MFTVARIGVVPAVRASSDPPDRELPRLDHEPDSAFGAHGLGRAKTFHGRRILDFGPARKFVSHLSLRTEEDFHDWARNARRGAVFIPRDPVEAYGEAWEGWDDFLGTPVDFETARRYARALRLPSQQAWWALAREGALPHRVPERPGQYYKNRGWRGYDDFLGLSDDDDDGGVDEA